MHMTNYWQGERVRLRAIEPEDAPIFQAWNDDQETSRNMDFIWPPGSLAAQRQWAEETAKKKPVNDEIFLVIENRAGDIVGIINSHSCDRRVGNFKYGVAIRPEHRQRGYASEAIRLLLAYFFHELRYQKVTVDVYSFNPASVSLHERLGFIQEGRLRRVLYTGGQHHDMFVFGMTVEEFEGGSLKFEG
jgi:RimJ/RimL family protein N-acetyltransferase